MGDPDDLEAGKKALKDLKTEREGILSTLNSIKEAEEKVKKEMKEKGHLLQDESEHESEPSEEEDEDQTSKTFLNSKMARIVKLKRFEKG